MKRLGTLGMLSMFLAISTTSNPMTLSQASKAYIAVAEPIKLTVEICTGVVLLRLLTLWLDQYAVEEVPEIMMPQFSNQNQEDETDQ